LALKLSIPAYRYARRSDRGWVPDESGGSREAAALQALYDRLKQAVQSLASIESRRRQQAYQFGDVPWLLAAVASMLIVLTLLALHAGLRFGEGWP
jgi:hypothetical protein